MTSPADNYWFERLDKKLDRLLETVSTHSAEIATLKVEHVNLKDDVTELKKTADESKKTKTSWRQVSATIALSSLVALFVGFIPALFHIH